MLTVKQNGGLLIVRDRTIKVPIGSPRNAFIIR